VSLDDQARQSPPIGFSAHDGLATLRPDAVALRSALDTGFLGWAVGCGAQQVIYPPLVDVQALASIDYFANFPHLAITISGLNAAAIRTHQAAGQITTVAPEDLEPARYALPSAACYGVYFDLRDSTLAQPRFVTTAATCCRREDSYEGLRRLLAFSMREIVCIGERDAVATHLERFKQAITGLLEVIGLPVEIMPSSDPFYDGGGSRALMQQLFPVKEEVVYGDDLAIASLNFHRNFFGERCNIVTADGGHAFSGCVAFGLERWIAALTSHFGEGGDELAVRVADAFSGTAKTSR
jgi:seryl-tRNA synthetase